MDNFFGEFNFGDEDFDHELYKEYIKNIYESLTGKEFKESDMSDLDIDGEGLFFQPLNEDDSFEGKKFIDNYIKENNMEVSIDIEETINGRIIKENWISKDETIEVNKMYQYDYRIISKLDTYIQLLILNKSINMCLEVENYEEAALIRDKINLLNE